MIPSMLEPDQNYPLRAVSTKQAHSHKVHGWSGPRLSKTRAPIVLSFEQSSNRDTAMSAHGFKSSNADTPFSYVERVSSNNGMVDSKPGMIYSRYRKLSSSNSIISS